MYFIRPFNRRSYIALRSALEGPFLLLLIFSFLFLSSVFLVLCSIFPYGNSGPSDVLSHGPYFFLSFSLPFFHSTLYPSYRPPVCPSLACLITSIACLSTYYQMISCYVLKSPYLHLYNCHWNFFPSHSFFMCSFIHPSFFSFIYPSYPISSFLLSYVCVCVFVCEYMRVCVRMSNLRRLK